MSIFGVRRHPELPEGYLPSFEGATGWVNSEPLSFSELHGKALAFLQLDAETVHVFARNYACHRRVQRNFLGFRRLVIWFDLLHDRKWADEKSSQLRKAGRGPKAQMIFS